MKAEHYLAGFAFLLYLLTLYYLIKTENAENPQKSRH